jgi:hypothetical protein
MLRSYKEGDEYGILELFRLVFGKEYYLEQWNWQVRDNPR